MGISILGIGVNSALGSGITTFRAGLTGRVRPNIISKEIQTSTESVRSMAYVCKLKNPGRYISKRLLRRANHLIQMAMVSSFQAIEDSGFEIKDEIRTGIAFGSGYGMPNDAYNFSISCFEENKTAPSPIAFANSVQNSLAAHVSIATGITGPCQSFSCFEQTLVPVLLTAEGWLANDVVDYVIAGIGDEYTPYRAYCTVVCGQSNPSAMSSGPSPGPGNGLPIQPFNFDKRAYVPGEGFVAFLLGKERPDAKYGNLSFSFSDSKDIKSSLHKPTAIFLNFDSMQLSEDRKKKDPPDTYADILNSGTKVASYTPLYGNMPGASGFDLAVAALSIKNKRLYPCPETSGSDDNLRLVRKDEPMADSASVDIPVYLGDGQYFVISVR